MTRRSVEGIVDALNTYGVRYLIAGGLAVVAHGYLRFTADVDIILDLEPENLPRAVAALESLGYRPRAPVPLHDFADPDKRRQWVVEKGLTVFSLYSPEHPATEINLFVSRRSTSIPLIVSLLGSRSLPESPRCSSPTRTWCA